MKKKKEEGVSGISFGYMFSVMLLSIYSLWRSLMFYMTESDLEVQGESGDFSLDCVYTWLVFGNRVFLYLLARCYLVCLYVIKMSTAYTL